MDGEDVTYHKFNIPVTLEELVSGEGVKEKIRAIGRMVFGPFKEVDGNGVHPCVNLELELNN
jgi:hypothetical protein